MYAKNMRPSAKREVQTERSVTIEVDFFIRIIKILGEVKKGGGGQLLPTFYWIYTWFYITYSNLFKKIFYSRITISDSTYY